MTSIRYSLPLSHQQQEQQQKEDTRSKVVFKDTGHQTMKDSGLEKWETNEVSSTISPSYCLEFPVHDTEKGTRESQADSLTWGDCLRIPEDQVLRVDKTESQRG